MKIILPVNENETAEKIDMNDKEEKDEKDDKKVKYNKKNKDNIVTVNNEDYYKLYSKKPTFSRGKQ